MRYIVLDLLNMQAYGDFGTDTRATEWAETNLGPLEQVGWGVMVLHKPVMAEQV